MRKQLVVGNWKMNNTSAETSALVSALRAELDELQSVDVAVAPAFPFLALAKSKLEGSRIGLSAQNVYWQESGAFTGEVSPAMLLDVGCEWVIIGHSERRQHFNETDHTVQRRVVAALKAGLKPIVCVGETAGERDQNKTLEVVKEQLYGALRGLNDEDLAKVVVAYEPVWAIGTGRVATPEQAQEVHAFIRATAREANDAFASSLRILYGGSVKGDNAKGLLDQPDIDGALVGGASLKADDFIRIARAAKGA